MGTTTACFEHSFASLPSGHSKICHFNVLVLVKKQVLGFEIAMTDIEAVAIVDSVDDLLEIMECF